MKSLPIDAAGQISPSTAKICRVTKDAEESSFSFAAARIADKAIGGILDSAGMQIANDALREGIQSAGFSIRSGRAEMRDPNHRFPITV